ncbi:MAG: hypothetical protein K0S47_3591 [Herbinix sp.]|jgi:hypothetical protein|nr:hypothetical protein [Herbinix sp.]
MKEIRYLDVKQLSSSAIFSPTYELIFAGTTISSMPDSYNDDTYKLLAEKYDIKFIFDSYIPMINFYAIPWVDIFAMDSNNGYWGTVGAATSIDNITAKICYISKQNEVSIVSNNLNSFIYPIASIDERKKINMDITDDIILFQSKNEAEKCVEFLELPHLDQE